MILSFAEAAAVVDPATTSIVALVTSLGPTGGIIVALWIWAQQRREEGRELREWMGTMVEQQRGDSDRREAAMRDVIGQQSEVMREFLRNSASICRGIPAPPVRRQQSS